MTQVSAAVALAQGVEAGAATGPLLDALVASVLEAPAVRLALLVREGGPFRVRRALELAELLLEGAQGAAAPAEGTG